jgi:antitoxin VapB
MSNERQVRLFRNGVNQAVRIPVEFEMAGTEAIMRKEGDKLILEPVKGDRLAALLDSWEPIEEPFPDIDDDLTGSLDEPRFES